MKTLEQSRKKSTAIRIYQKVNAYWVEMLPLLDNASISAKYELINILQKEIDTHYSKYIEIIENPQSVVMDSKVFSEYNQFVVLEELKKKTEDYYNRRALKCEISNNS